MHIPQKLGCPHGERGRKLRFVRQRCRDGSWNGRAALGLTHFLCPQQVGAMHQDMRDTFRCETALKIVLASAFSRKGKAKDAEVVVDALLGDHAPLLAAASFQDCVMVFQDLQWFPGGKKSRCFSSVWWVSTKPPTAEGSATSAQPGCI